MELIAKTCGWIALLGACLLGPTLVLAPMASIAWPQGWAVLGVYTGAVAAAFLLVDPELLRERARPVAGSDQRDSVYAIAGGLLLYPLTLLVAGLEHAAGGGPAELPARASLASLAVFVAGYALVLAAMRSNRFFTTIVRVQADRGHYVVDRGPYAWVRHPGYTGTIIAHLALPLALGSCWALLPAVLGCGLFVPRARAEEHTLAAGLPGYRGYQQRVRWRLAPGVW